MTESLKREITNKAQSLWQLTAQSSLARAIQILFGRDATLDKLSDSQGRELLASLERTGGQLVYSPEKEARIETYLRDRQIEDGTSAGEKM